VVSSRGELIHHSVRCGMFRTWRDVGLESAFGDKAETSIGAARSAFDAGDGSSTGTSGHGCCVWSDEHDYREDCRLGFVFVLLAGIAVLATGASHLAYRYCTRPTTLSVAVGSIDGEAANAMSAIASQLVSHDAPVRLKVIDAGPAPIRCRLRAAIAFPSRQPPAKESWRSDATPTPGYALQTEITEADPNGTDLVLGLNIRGDGRTDVMRYIESSGQAPNAFVFMAPPSQGAQSIGGDGEAVAMVMAVREELGKLLKARQLRMTRLFFYGPFALSVFLGQQLTSIGKIQLFEYQDPSYVPSCLLKT
jgi:hypothetical protein